MILSVSHPPPLRFRMSETEHLFIYLYKSNFERRQIPRPWEPGQLSAHHELFCCRHHPHWFANERITLLLVYGALVVTRRISESRTDAPISWIWIWIWSLAFRSLTGGWLGVLCRCG